MSAPPSIDFTTFYQQLDKLKSREVDRAGEMIKIPSGGIIYRQDAASDAVYIIESGVVEVLLESRDVERQRSLAYLSKGDVFGELGVLTSKPRTATAKACEPCVLRRITSENFLKLLRKMPQIGEYLSMQMADRLYRAAFEQYVQSYCVDFGGDLMNFDLLLVFQTIVTSGRNGELRLTNTNNDMIGGFFVRNGTIELARFAHLQGIEAVWQVFLSEQMEGRFEFQIIEEPTLEFDSDYRITLDGMDILMQAASKRDTYQSFAPSSRNLERRFSRLADDFAWEDDATRAAAEMVWSRITRRPQTLTTIWKLSNLSVMTLIEITREMRNKQLAKLDPPAENVDVTVA